MIIVSLSYKSSICWYTCINYGLNAGALELRNIILRIARMYALEHLLN